MTKLVIGQTALEYFEHFCGWFYKEYGRTPKNIIELRRYLQQREYDYTQNEELL